MCDCAICNGATLEDFHADLREKISNNGFTVMAVGSSYEKHGLAYTIGLSDGFGHPEMVVSGYPLGDAGLVLLELGRRVVRGERFDGDNEALVGGAPVGLREVHARHLRGDLMNGWIRYYCYLDRWDLELRALQVVLPDDDHCYQHQASQPRLDLPNHVSYDGMSRSQRRGHPRGRRPNGVAPTKRTRQRGSDM